jgi:hypothetical protein
MEQHSKMRFSIMARYALGVVAASAMLTACSGGLGSGTGSAASGLNPAFRPGIQAAFRMTNAVGYAPASEHHPNITWSKLPKGKKGGTTLVYVADGDNGEVEVYDYPKSKKEVGEQGGFEYPYGMCSDSKGDVFATDFDEGTLTEFTYGKASGKEILSGLYTPIGCSVDSKGDIAVSQFEGDAEGEGSVKIFKGGKGSGTEISYSEYTWPAGYDSKGDLYAEGEDGSCSSICVWVLPAGKTKAEGVTFDETIDFPGAVESNGKSMEFGDQEPGGAYALGIYTETCSGTKCKNTKSTTATSDCDGTDTDVVQFAEYSKSPNGQDPKGGVSQVAGGNLFCTDNWDIWNFPKGGTDTGTISGPERALGQTIVN